MTLVLIFPGGVRVSSSEDGSVIAEFDDEPLEIVMGHPRAPAVPPGPLRRPEGPLGAASARSSSRPELVPAGDGEAAQAGPESDGWLEVTNALR